MREQGGLTLIELLVTLAVMAVVMTVGVPTLATLIRSNRTAADTNELVATLHAARSEALKNVVQVTVCKSSDQTNCDADLSWHDGWVVFIDDDADGDHDGTETILRVHGPLEGANTLQSTAFADWVAFRPDGLVIGSGGNSGSFNLCNEHGSEYGRDISISRTGSPHVGPSGDGACS